MKKKITTRKYKYRNKINAKRLLRRKLAFREYKKQKNKVTFNEKKRYNVKSQRNKKRKIKQRYKDYEIIKAPINFSFINNPNSFIDFIKQIEIQFEKRKKVFIELKDVSEINYCAIVVLLSILVKFKSNKISFNGDFPNNNRVKRVLQNSGFFECLGIEFKEQDRYFLNEKMRNSFHTHAFKLVDSELSSKIINEASKTIWGEEKRCQGVQTTLVELMLNTHNHANLEKQGENHWWISVYHDEINKKVSFSFIDFGVGVFSSLQNKKEDSIWYNCINSMKKNFNFIDNSNLLKLILEGKLHKTITGKYYRGKGLPGLKETCDRNQLSNLHIITNDAYAKVENEEYQNLSKNFNGTFVYWEINNKNVNYEAN